MAVNPKKHEMPTQAPEVRAHNFNEVALGYDQETALAEANRCLNCKNRPCVSGCPVNIHIPEFIAKVKEGAFDVIYKLAGGSADETLQISAVTDSQFTLDNAIYHNLKK